MRPVRVVIVLALAVIASVLAACSGVSTVPPSDPPSANVAAGPALPGPASAAPLPPPATPPKPVAGLDDLDLDKRESALFFRLVAQLYAPCPSEAVSILQCVEESRPCAACRPAARLLAAKVHEGAAADQVREIYALRFGPDVKPIDAADSPTRGPADAPVTIVVFSDFECPHCRHAMPVLDQLTEKYAPRVRLVHKFYPLNQHAHAKDAARAAIAALNQGKYWEMERTLFSHQSEQTEADLLKYAKELGLDLKRFKADMKAERTDKILERDHDAGEKAGLDGTPYILVNGRLFDNRYFHVDPDLDAWIKLELELAAAAKGAR
jgi:2-hydroxychromene-2-carboxylate isomerase